MDCPDVGGLALGVPGKADPPQFLGELIGGVGKGRDHIDHILFFWVLDPRVLLHELLDLLRKEFPLLLDIFIAGLSADIEPARLSVLSAPGHSLHHEAVIGDLV